MNAETPEGEDLMARGVSPEPLLQRAKSWLNDPEKQHLRGFYCYTAAIEVASFAYHS